MSLQQDATIFVSIGGATRFILKITSVSKMAVLRLILQTLLSGCSFFIYLYIYLSIYLFNSPFLSLSLTLSLSPIWWLLLFELLYSFYILLFLFRLHRSFFLSFFLAFFLSCPLLFLCSLNILLFLLLFIGSSPFFISLAIFLSIYLAR